MTNIKNASLFRCSWCESDELYVQYHDKEWGVPINNDVLLFEYLTLEGAQAGLNWLTVLKKRNAYRKKFANFDVKKIARFSEKEVNKLLLYPGIIRNRLKISSVITNARAFLNIQKEFGSFSNYQWRFVDGTPILNRWENVDEIPQFTNISEQFSRDLKLRGFKFVGAKIMYAYMQAVGMVNDHITDCFRFKEINRC